MKIRTVRITFSVHRPRGHYLAQSVYGVSPDIHGRCISVTYPRLSKTRSDLQSWSKRLGHLIIYKMICAFSNNPPHSPPDSVGCYRPKTLKKSFKVYELQLCSGGGGGGRRGKQETVMLKAKLSPCIQLFPLHNCLLL